MSLKSVSIELDENTVVDIVLQKLLAERKMLKRRDSSCANKAEYLRAIDIVLEYFDADLVNLK